MKTALCALAIFSIFVWGEEPPKWADDAANHLREGMKKNKYEEICAFYGKIKQAGMGIPAEPKIEISHRGPWSVVVLVERIDKKADLLTAAEGQDIALIMELPHNVGIRKNDLGASFYFIVWKERHNDVDYLTLTAIKLDGTPVDQFAPKALRDVELAEAQKSECVQPDYAKWGQVRDGMSEDELKKLLGDPLRDSGIPEAFRNDPTYARILTFGRIRFPSPALPGSLEFQITIQQGKVSAKLDPFSGELSKDGKPTTPIQITPKDRATLDPAVPFVDLRWRASSGEYPVIYVIEVEFAQHKMIDGKGHLAYVGKKQYRSDCPYLALASGGMNTHRWRVMALNNKGQSAWTEWRYFRFEAEK